VAKIQLLNTKSKILYFLLARELLPGFYLRNQGIFWDHIIFQEVQCASRVQKFNALRAFKSSMRFTRSRVQCASRVQEFNALRAFKSSMRFTRSRVQCASRVQGFKGSKVQELKGSKFKLAVGS
jgi:sRNA-binding protein